MAGLVFFRNLAVNQFAVRTLHVATSKLKVNVYDVQLNPLSVTDPELFALIKGTTFNFIRHDVIPNCGLRPTRRHYWPTYSTNFELKDKSMH